MIEAVLYTDLSKHFEFVGRLKALCEKHGSKAHDQLVAEVSFRKRVASGKDLLRDGGGVSATAGLVANKEGGGAGLDGGSGGGGAGGGANCGSFDNGRRCNKSSTALALAAHGRAAHSAMNAVLNSSRNSQREDGRCSYMLTGELARPNPHSTRNRGHSLSSLCTRLAMHVAA